MRLILGTEQGPIWQSLALTVALCLIACHAAAEEPLSGPLLVPNSTQSPSSRAPDPTVTDAAQSSYAGVMGEVARPGVYEVTPPIALDEIVKRAGGVTPEASGSVRVFRAGRLTQQVFLPSTSLVVAAGDLVVVERQHYLRPTLRTAEKPGEPGAPDSSSEVQIAFLNLVDRPVVAKMATEQATVARIVEILGQSADVAAHVRVIGPSGAGAHRNISSAGSNSLLDSGTVLIFPQRLVRRDALPQLPAPIAPALLESQSKPPIATFERAPDPASPGPSMGAENWKPQTRDNGMGGQDRGSMPAETEVPERERVQSLFARRSPEKLEATPAPESERTAGSPEPLAAMADSKPIAVRENPTSRRYADPALNIEQPHRREKSDKTHTSRVALLLYSITAIAGLALLLTLASITQRWISLARAARKSAAGVVRRESKSILPAIPLPTAIPEARRTIRVDAGQPRSRLGLDLVVIEGAGKTRSDAKQATSAFR